MYDAVSLKSHSHQKGELINPPQCITIVIAHEEDGVLMSLLYSCFGVSFPSTITLQLSRVVTPARPLSSAP